nr:succinyldiaminopimelate transaminase [uncultured Nocardioides sp.]
MRAQRASKPVSSRLPEFPWDRIAGYGERARAHPDGIVDLSIGTPVDPTPTVVREALAAGADSPGYPATAGRPETRRAILDWLARRCGVIGATDASVLPLLGSKEAISALGVHLGLGPGDLVVQPSLAYPSYEVGAKLVGAEIVASDEPETLDRTPALVWINSPSNPSGRVTSPERLRELVTWARDAGVLLVSDECYVECSWHDPATEQGPSSILHPDVCGDSHDGLLAVHSLSKRSNLAGYRCAFYAGDPAVVGELLEVRKNLGLMMPGPQQTAMVAALDDDEHVVEQRHRYAARRATMWRALEGVGFRIDHSEAALYLWSTRDESCWDTMSWLAERGILAAPGAFYGTAGERHVRIAVTATDERITAAAQRLA